MASIAISTVSENPKPVARGTLCGMSNGSQTDLPLPYLTAGLSGVGGVIKRYDDDFVVEEIPLYPAGGEGTHVYFTIEKRGLTTLAAIRIIARALCRSERDIGYAGLKDAHGLTRQRLSLEHLDEDRVNALSLSRIRVLSVERHTNKIKLGHLAGNRFAIKIRDCLSDAEPRARAVLDVLRQRGVPNYFGPQRFGVRGDNAAIGRAVLTDDYAEAVALLVGRPGLHDRGDIRKARELFEAGDFAAAENAWPTAHRTQRRACRAMQRSGGDAAKAWRVVDHTLRKLYVSAVQSKLFNQVLAARIESIDRLEPGDLAWLHCNGACFVVQDAAGEQPRSDAFEISPTGPLFGRRMTEARGRPGELEAAVLAASGLSREKLRAKDGTMLDGARRPLRVPLTDSGLTAGEDDRGPYLQLTFTLEPGAYATNVTREVCKSEAG